MKSWKTEREKLIEETLAFVQSVSSTAPDTTKQIIEQKLQPYRPALQSTQQSDEPAADTHTVASEIDCPEPDTGDGTGHVAATPSVDQPASAGSDIAQVAEAAADKLVPADMPTESEEDRNDSAAVEAKVAGVLKQGESHSAPATETVTRQPVPLGLKPIRTASSTPRHELTLSERSQIKSRVEAFKAHQVRQLEEREAYVRQVQEKIRGALETNQHEPR